MFQTIYLDLPDHCRNQKLQIRTETRKAEHPVKTLLGRKAGRTIVPFILLVRVDCAALIQLTMEKNTAHCEPKQPISLNMLFYPPRH